MKKARYKYLLDTIICNDSPLQDTMSIFPNDKGHNHMIDDFETTALFLTHCNPDTKRKITGEKRDHASIS